MRQAKQTLGRASGSQLIQHLVTNESDSRMNWDFIHRGPFKLKEKQRYRKTTEANCIFQAGHNMAGAMCPTYNMTSLFPPKAGVWGPFPWIWMAL